MSAFRFTLVVPPREGDTDDARAGQAVELLMRAAGEAKRPPFPVQWSVGTRWRTYESHGMCADEDVCTVRAQLVSEWPGRSKDDMAQLTTIVHAALNTSAMIGIPTARAKKKGTQEEEEEAH